MPGEEQGETAAQETTATLSVPVPSDRFRHVISHLAGGVTVVTVLDGQERHGMTASSVTSLSLEPPTLLCCLNRRSNTGQAVARSGAFAVNILEEGQVHLAERFALNRPSPEKFAGVALLEDASGQPLLVDALAHLVCQVRETVDGGTHLIFLADVLKAETRLGRPLAYYRGTFGHFAFDEGTALPDPDERRAGADRAEDRDQADRARARLAIELGAIELGALGLLPGDGTAGNLARGALAAAEGALAARAAELPGLHQAVHTALVAFAGSPALDQAHRRLRPPSSLPPAGMTGTPPSFELLGELLSLDRQALERILAGDLEAATGALEAHLALEGAAVLGAGGDLDGAAESDAGGETAGGETAGGARD